MCLTNPPLGMVKIWNDWNFNDDSPTSRTRRSYWAAVQALFRISRTGWSTLVNVRIANNAQECNFQLKPLVFPNHLVDLLKFRNMVLVDIPIATSFVYRSTAFILNFEFHNLSLFSLYFLFLFFLPLLSLPFLFPSSSNLPFFALPSRATTCTVSMALCSPDGDTGPMAPRGAQRVPPGLCQGAKSISAVLWRFMEFLSFLMCEFECVVFRCALCCHCLLCVLFYLFLFFSLLSLSLSIFLFAPQGTAIATLPRQGQLPSLSKGPLVNSNEANDSNGSTSDHSWAQWNLCYPWYLYPHGRLGSTESCTSACDAKIKDWGANVQSNLQKTISII